ncbi:biotin--[acetyl-CoA-carboxylase] ligase [Lacticaseibacillus sp. GG6-2]
MATTKQRVLTALLDRAPEWQSGDGLAQELGLSRESVWKAITTLRKQGHQIEARKSQGYRYLGSDHLDADVIGFYMRTTTHLEVASEATSTQDAAKRWLANQATPEPAVFVADAQTAGYGRRGRTFYSPAATGLYLSVVLPNAGQDLSQVGLLTTGVATAVVEVLQEFYPQAALGLKWVNDIVANGHKVGGILCEAVLALESATTPAFVVGIGLNLATTDFPPALQAIAGAISHEISNRNRLAAAISQVVLAMAVDYRSGAFLPTYRALSTVIGRQVTLALGTREVTGLVLGIADNGGLRLQTANGEETYTSGEVIKVAVDG